MFTDALLIYSPGNCCLSALKLNIERKFHIKYEAWYSLVIGQSPDQAANGVADPEEGLNKRWSPVFLTDPIILEKTKFMSN